MKTMKKTSAILLVICITVLSTVTSCKDNYDFSLDEMKSSDIHPTMAIPLAYGTLTLDDFIEEIEDTIIFEDDNSIKIVYRKDSLFSIKVSEFYSAPVLDPVTEIATLGNIEIDDIPINLVISLEDFFVNLSLGSLPADGTQTFFPSINQNGGDPFPVEHFDDFKKATLAQGTMQLTLTNEFPVDIISAEMTILNGSTSIGSFIFSNIPSGENQFRSIDLAGKTINNDLKVEISSIRTASSTGLVKINKSDALKFNGQLINLKASSGIAVWSDQTVPKENTEVDFGENLTNGERLNTVELKSGTMNFNINSNVNADIDVMLTIHSLLRNGSKVEQLISVGKNSSEIQSIDMTNAVLDLTQGDRGYNTIIVSYDIGNQQMRQYVGFTAEDFIEIDVTFDNLDFKYVEGYLGNHTVNIDEDDLDLGIDIFDQIDGGLKLTDPTINLLVENSIGIPVEINLNMTGESSEGNTQALNPIPLVITAPTARNTPVSSIISINKTNSSIIDFLALPPQIIKYSAVATANKNNTITATNFVNDDSYIKLGIEMELPLSLQTNALGVKDTLDFTAGTDDLDQIDSAALYVHTINGLPFDVAIELLMLDEQGQVIGSIQPSSSLVLKSAEVDATGRVSNPTENDAEIKVTKDLIDKLKDTEKIIVVGKLNTYKKDGIAVPVTLYTDYALDINLRMVAQFNINLSD